MQTRNRLVIIVLVFTLVSLMIPMSLVQGQGGDLADLGGREVVIAVENQYPPFNTIDDSGQGVGWDYDVWNAICEQINCTPVFLETAWDGIFAAAAAGEFDVAADGITITEERRQTVDFSDPYMEYGQMLLVQAEEDRFADAASFAANPDLRAATQIGTTNEIAAIELVGADRVDSYGTFGAAVQALLTGDADAVVIDSVAGTGWITENPGQLRFIGQPFTSELLGFAYQPGSDLVEPVNQALWALRRDGTMWELYQRWFEPDAEPVALPDFDGQEIVVAVENQYPPFNTIDDSGQGVGWDYDFWTELCVRFNCTPVFQETAWDGIFAAAAAGEFDVAADGITITEERRQTVDFSIPYIEVGQVLLASADEDRYANAEEFAANTDLRVATQIGTTNEIAAIDLVGADRVDSYGNFGAAVQAVLTGDADAVVIDTVAGLGWIAENPGQLKFVGEPFTREPLGFAYAPGSELVAPVDVAIRAMRADGTLAMLYDRWFVPDEAAAE